MAVPLTTIVSQCLVDIAGGNTATIPAGTTAQLLGASGTAGVANLLTIEATGGASVAITDGIITFGAPVPGGSGTVGTGTMGELAYFAAAGTAVAGLPLGAGVLTTLGTTPTGSGALVLANSPTITGVLTAPTIDVIGDTFAQSVYVTDINGMTVSSNTGTIDLANGSALVTIGAFSTTLTATAATALTLPTSGTLATTANVAAVSTVANAALVKTNNLSDLTNGATARTNLGLGGAAVLNVGTIAGTVADGGALTTETTRATAAEALLASITSVTAEITRAEAAEALLAPKASPTFTGTVTIPAGAAITGYALSSSVTAETTRAEAAESAAQATANAALVKSNNLSDLTNATTARSNLGLGGAAILNVGTTTGTVADGGALATEITRATAAEALKAPISSPIFTGVPAAPTATAGTNTTQLASTAFVTSAVGVEVSRATAAEALLASIISLTAETTRAQTAEALLAPKSSPTFTGTANFATIASGAWQGTAVAAPFGGTGQTAYAVGDLLYASSTTALSPLHVGTNGYVMTMVSGLPAWAAASGGGITAADGTTISNTSGTISVLALPATAPQLGTQTLTHSSGGVTGTAAITAQSGTASATSCTIAGSVLTVGGTVTGVYGIGMTITGTSVAANSIIISLGTGTGGAGTYNLSASSTVSTAETITGTYNVNIVIQPSGNGSFSLQVPTGTTAGGNARGANCIDLQTTRNAATQVASGSNAVAIGANNTATSDANGSVAIGVSNTATYGNAVAIGYGNSAAYNNIAIGESNNATNEGAIAIGRVVTSSGYYSQVIGANSVASNNYSTAIGMNVTSSGGSGVALGNNANDQSRTGTLVYAVGQWASKSGQQIGFSILGAVSTTTGANRLTSDGGAAGSHNIINLINNEALAIDKILIIVRDTTTGDQASFYLSPGISVRRGATASTTALVGTPAWTMGGNTGGGSVSAMTASSIGLSADTTNGGINLSVTCGTTNSTDILAKIEFIEVQ